MITPTMKLRVQHSLTPGAKALRLPVPPTTTFEELGCMVAQRLALKVHSSLQFETEDGDTLSGMDRVGDLLDEGETVVASFATAAQPILQLPAGQLYIGTVAPVAELEECENEADLAQPEEDDCLEVEELAVMPTHSVAPKPKKTAHKAVQKAQKSVVLEIPEAAFGALIGKKGGNLKKLQAQHCVKLNLDRHTAGTGKGRCEIKGGSSAAAQAGAAAVQKIVQGVEAEEQRRALEEQHTAIRRLPLEEAQQAVSGHNRVKTLRTKLKKIEQTKARVANNDPWVEGTQLDQLKLEAAYRAELEELSQEERLPLKQLQGRVARKGSEWSETKVATEYEWDGKGAVVDLMCAEGGKVMGRERRQWL
eukprot:TRINITY_DN26918_c0_g1_i1.p1 TRINITY_DN26918_c0_g1~~TRINITY_DN26918_c0_g1_i1.p1  ORF type:complete len:364 (-),score=123.81 TRINITY_DN26918_c0_g1_i1:88-1179(-)